MNFTFNSICNSYTISIANQNSSLQHQGPTKPINNDRIYKYKSFLQWKCSNTQFSAQNGKTENLSFSINIPNYVPICNAKIMQRIYVVCSYFLFLIVSIAHSDLYQWKKSTFFLSTFLRYYSIKWN